MSSSSDTDTAQDEQVAVRRTARRARQLTVVLLVIALLPSALSLSGLAPSVLSRFHPQLAAVTRFDHLSLHWWAPVECRGLQVSNTRDWAATAPPLLTAVRIRTRQPLWKLAVNLGRDAEIIAEQPVLTVIQSEQHLNLAEALEDLAGTSASSSNSPFPLILTVENGQVLAAAPVATAATDQAQEWQTTPLVAGFQCRISTLDAAAGLPEVELVAELSGAEATPVASRRNDFGGATVHPRIAARLDDLAADFAPLQLPPVETESPSSGPPSLQLRSTLPTETDPGRLQFAAHDVSLAQLQPLLAQLLPDTHCQGRTSVRGEARLLGRTLTSGCAIRIAARGRDIRWHQHSWAPGESLLLPHLTADCALAVAEDGILLQKLSLACPLATVQGEGEVRLPQESLLDTLPIEGIHSSADTAAVQEAQAAAAGRIRIAGQLDLVEVCRQLPSTLQLREGLVLREGAIRFSARTELNAPSNEAGMTWQAVAESTPLRASLGRERIQWDSPVRLRMSGPLQTTGPGIESAILSGDFGSLSALPNQDQLKIQGEINVARLWDHLGQFIAGPAPGIHGPLQVSAVLPLVRRNGIHVRDLKLASANLNVQSPALTIRPQAPLAEMLNGQLSLRGTGDAVQSLLRPWTNIDWLAPESDTTLDLHASAARRMTLVAEIRPPGTASLSNRRWHRVPAGSIQQARLLLDISEEGQQYIVRAGKLQLPGLTAVASGRLIPVDESLNTSLNVEMDYDLATLTSQLLQDPHGQIRLSGQHRQQFRVSGCLDRWNLPSTEERPSLQVEGTLAWDDSQIYGMRLGAGNVAVRMANGQLQTDNLRCALNGGQLSTMANYNIAATELQLAAGSRLENVTVTEELAAEWLGYVAPFLSDATLVRGVLSARLRQFAVPLDAPEQGILSGMIDVQEVTASPGESLSSLLRTVDLLRKQQRSLVRDLTLPAQRIQFQMQDGVVQHDQVVLELSGYQLQTSGRVGLNQRLDLMVAVPLERSSATEAGRRVNLPVSGTVRQPQIDVNGVLREAGSQQLQNEIDRQLDRGLNRLFDRLR